MRVDGPEGQDSPQPFDAPQPAATELDDLHIQLNLDEGTVSQQRRRKRRARMGRTLWFCLAALSLVLLVAAIVPELIIAGLRLDHSGSVDLYRRLIMGGAAVGVGLVTFGLHSHFAHTMAVANLPTGARLLVGPRGVIVHHPGLLQKDLRFGWNFITAINIDAGMDPNGKDNDRRFPVSRTDPPRYLYDPDDVNSVPLVVMDTDLRSPNVVIVFRQPVTVRSDHAAILATVFGPRGRHVPVVAPGLQTYAIAMMFTVEDIRDARAAFLPSGRLRALRSADFAPPRPAPGA